jgi:DNA-binding MarR family transcriptional regulator
MDDPLALDRQVCFALAAASRAVVALYRPILEPLGLTHPQYLVMLSLWEKSPRRVGEIADALYLESATLSPLLKRLQAAGLIERVRDSEDERALQITLTPEGTGLRRQAELVPGRVVQRLGVPVEDLEDLRDRLSDLLQRTGQLPA